jgi:spore maturation protein SpmB
MHAVLIPIILVAGVIWLAIEFPNFRKALWITLGLCMLLVIAAVMIVTHHG